MQYGHLTVPVSRFQLCFPHTIYSGSTPPFIPAANTRGKVPELFGYSKFYLAQSLLKLGESEKAIEIAQEGLEVFR
jgi:hypothetical protein